MFPDRVPVVALAASCFLAGAGAVAVGAPPIPTTYPSMTPDAEKVVAKDGLRHFGDAPDEPGPLATDLSAELEPKAIRKAMLKVGDWELARHEAYFDATWTWGALYTGFMAANEPRYTDAMVRLGEKLSWKLGPVPQNADHTCVAQTYLELYEQRHDPKMIAATRADYDKVVRRPDDPKKPLYWWCDALFMGPPGWARLSKVTSDAKYLDYANRQWWITSGVLYDKDERLFARDATFFPKREHNGKKVFWSRGEGWVVGGLVRVLQTMPADYPERPKYVEQLKTMCERVAELQGDDGLWRAGMLDPDAYVLPENSGSAFFVYATAWCINEGLLDRAKYEPVVEKGWKGLLAHVYADGRLGCIQQTGAAPATFKPGSSYCYGVGSFLLAGSELERMAKGSH